MHFLARAKGTLASVSHLAPPPLLSPPFAASASVCSKKRGEKHQSSWSTTGCLKNPFVNFSYIRFFNFAYLLQTLPFFVLKEEAKVFRKLLFSQRYLFSKTAEKVSCCLSPDVSARTGAKVNPTKKK